MVSQRINAAYSLESITDRKHGTISKFVWTAHSISILNDMVSFKAAVTVTRFVLTGWWPWRCVTKTCGNTRIPYSPQCKMTCLNNLHFFLNLCFYVTSFTIAHKSDNKRFTKNCKQRKSDLTLKSDNTMSSVNTVTRTWSGWQMTSKHGQTFFPVLMCSDCLCGPSRLIQLVMNRISFPGVKLPWYEVYYFSVLVLRLKMTGAIPTLPHVLSQHCVYLTIRATERFSSPHTVLCMQTLLKI